MEGDGALWAPRAGDMGPLAVLPEGALEEVETTDPDREVMRLGFKSGVPLAYMNLVSRRSGVEAGRGGGGGENGAEVATVEPALGGSGGLVPLA